MPVINLTAPQQGMPEPIYEAYQRDPRLIYAQKLMEQGIDGGPVRTPLQGIGKLANTLVGVYQQKKLKDQYQGESEAYQKALAGLLGGKSLDEMQAAAATNPYLREKLGLPLALQRIEAEQQATTLAAKEASEVRRLEHQEMRDQARYENMTKTQQRQFDQQLEMQSRRDSAAEGRLEKSLAAADARAERAASRQSVMKPPPGYRFTPDGGLEVIPGGPASTKQELAAEKAQTAAVLAGSKADTVINMIDKGLEQTSADTTGLKGSILGQLPGTKSYDLRNTIDTVKANIGFKELSDMRAASPTGGALGQVAVKELDFLQSSIASLNQGQSEAQLRENLNKVKTHYHNWKNVMQRAAASPQAGSPASAATSEQGVVNWDDLP